VKPKASFYMWAKVPREDMSSAEFAEELLKRAHILVIPGEAYGKSGAGYVRFSLTVEGDNEGERCQEAVARITSSGLIPSPMHCSSS
jgi:aspartate/methionine/tyrosine aminotransferase